jgi:sialic acid synthase SpsE
VHGRFSAQGSWTYRWGSFLQHLLLGIFFTASAMDEKSAVFLDSLHVPFIKIGSGDVNNLRLLKIGKEKNSSELHKQL